MKKYLLIILLFFGLCGCDRLQREEPTVDVPQQKVRFLVREELAGKMGSPVVRHYVLIVENAGQGRLRFWAPEGELASHLVEVVVPRFGNEEYYFSGLGERTASRIQGKISQGRHIEYVWEDLKTGQKGKGEGSR